MKEVGRGFKGCAEVAGEWGALRGVCSGGGDFEDRSDDLMDEV